MSKSDDLQGISQEIGHPHNVKSRLIKAHLKIQENYSDIHTLPVILGKTPQEFDKLVDDLVSFVRTGAGPSDSLDAELKKDKSSYAQLAADIQKSAKLGFTHLYPLSPLEYSLKNIHIYPNVFKYLLVHGSDYLHNQIEEKTLPNHLLSNKDLLLDSAQFLIQAGYFAITSEMTKKIYRRPSIAFREKFDKMIWGSSLSEFARMNKRVFFQACYDNELTMVEYCRQQGINIDLLSDKDVLLKNVSRLGRLEILKYLLQHAYYSQSQIKDTLVSAVESNQIQIVNYLINYSELKEIPINQFSLLIENELNRYDNSAAIYCRYLNPNLTVDLQVYKREFVASQQYQVCQTDKVLQDAIKYFKKEFFISRSTVNEMKLMQLALTSKAISEEQAQIPAHILRLSAISRLPLIDPFAVEYAMYRVECSIQKNTTSAEMLDLLAIFYSRYVKNTAHIETSIRENFNNLLNIMTRFHRPDSLLAIQEASEADLTLCPLQVADKTLLPKALSWLVMGYIVLQTGSTPTLIHMFRALQSKEKCCHCDTVLLSTNHEIIFLGNKNKAIKSEGAVRPEKMKLFL